MPYQQYIIKRFNKKTQVVIQQANGILAEYSGYSVTLRQLYYRFVARDLIPNSLKSYKRLGKTINDARLAGLIDWDSLIDMTRNLRGLRHYNDPKDGIDSLVRTYHIDLWADQEWRPEVWIEKDAMVGVVSRVCQEYDVPYFSCRGFTSQSEMWRAAERLQGHFYNGQKPCILHFGDHDPSGMDMTRDIKDRLYMFMDNTPTYKRIALNMNQVKKYKLPPNPAKSTDSRYQTYKDEFGDASWELDALEPPVIVDLVEKSIKKLMDASKWNASIALCESQRKDLEKIAKWYPNIQERKKKKTKKKTPPKPRRKK